MLRVAEVIKYEGDNKTFIWKHPSEDFNNLTQLIVHESQEAIFFMNGQALDLFGPGRYTLETQNLPKLTAFLKRLVGKGGDTFHCEVYFINKTVQMSLRWGTDTKVRFLDPTYGVPLEIGASGEMNLMVSDARKLLVKLVGTTKGIAWEEGVGTGFSKSLAASFRPLISTSVKSNLASSIKARNIDILEIDENLGILSESLRASMLPGFEEYGLTIPQFYVNTVVLPPDTDPNFRQIRELHTIALQKRMVEAKAEVDITKAESDATVTAARRQVVIEQQTTETEVARRAAERELIDAQTKAEAAKLKGFAEADIARAQGFADADVMQAKGYNQKDVLQAEVQKAYAEGIGNMNISGNGGVAGDMLGLGIGMAAAGALSGQVGDMFKGFNIPQADTSKQVAKIVCPNCKSEVPENSKFCLECGTKIEILAENEMICPSCGQKTNKGKFCMECGAALVKKCAKCGAELVPGAKFCLECGEKI